MRSLKPGRGPSAKAAAGSALAIMFGIIWTVMAYSLTRNVPFPMVGTVFPLFGVLSVVMGVINLGYHLYNASQRNRLSLLDLTEEGEEPDPLNLRFGPEKGREEGEARARQPRRSEGEYCPYCGEKVGRDVDFCPHCGKDI
jgi:hypothetical protein